MELSAVKEENKNAADSLSDRILALLSANPNCRYTLKEMADTFFVSTKTVENAMKKRVNMSFAAYQMDRKLEMARVWLTVSPEIRLRELSQLLGFTDEFHLSKAFRKKYGVPPGEYRRLGENGSHGCNNPLV